MRSLVIWLNRHVSGDSFVSHDWVICVLKPDWCIITLHLSERKSNSLPRLQIFIHTSICSVFISVELVSKMTRFHFLIEYFFSSLLRHQLLVLNSFYMLLFRGAESVTWRTAGKVAWKTARWVRRRRKGRLVRLSILLSCVSFDEPETLPCCLASYVWRSLLKCLWVIVFMNDLLFFCLVSSQSRPVSWAPLSLVPWAHLSSTATTCQ